MSSSAGVEVQIDIQKYYQDAKNPKEGYIPINANNDNHSPMKWGIPTTRDLELSTPIPDEKDLVELSLHAKAKDVKDPSVRLSLSFNGRDRIKIWKTATKNGEIGMPKEWALKDLPPKVFAEGVVNADKPRKITATLDLLSGGAVLASDSVTLTVVPAITSLTVTAAPGSAPVGNSTFKPGSYYLTTQPAGGGSALTYKATMLRTGLHGSPMISQKARYVDTPGATIAPPPTLKVLDFAVPNAGKYLMDSGPVAAFPLYSNKQAHPAPDTVQDTDSPAIDVTKVLPGAAQTTSVNVSQSFVTFAVWQFPDKSIYYLAKTDDWSVNYVGTLAPAAGGRFTFTPGAGNGISTPAAYTLDNTTPAEVIAAPPPPAVPLTANTGGGDWR